MQAGEDLISKLSYEEMVSLIADGQTELDVIGKPATKDKDGSNGRAEVFAVSGIQGIPYGVSAWRAATFNKDLNYQVGRMIGENMLHASDASSMKVGLYGFSCNAHRSPYSGRNYEYYSEDPFLAGCAISHEVKGLVEKGGVTFMKHFAGNDQETYRHGVPSWANEQTLREIYLKPFAMAMTEGGANGLMTGFNRLGMHWTGANAALLKGFAEGEEGYRGLTLTDAYETDYMDTIDGILNGTHAWLNGTGYKNTDGVLLQDDYRSDPVIQDAVFNTVHRILYVMANSLAMNGMTHDTALGATDQKSAMIAAEDIPDKTVAFLPATMMTSFYEDKTFSLNVMMSFFGSAFSDTGTWDYSDDGGLSMKYSDGTDIEVSEKDGVFFWSKDVVSDLLGPRTATGALSRYELTTAANKAMGTKYAVPDKPLYAGLVLERQCQRKRSGTADHRGRAGRALHDAGLPLVRTLPDLRWLGTSTVRSISRETMCSFWAMQIWRQRQPGRIRCLSLPRHRIPTSIRSSRSRPCRSSSGAAERSGSMRSISCPARGPGPSRVQARRLRCRFSMKPESRSLPASTTEPSRMSRMGSTTIGASPM
ncbi:MAG: hypothetical protein LKE27_08235 [Atopobiaceae bacterium]|jgi:beta-glucosidase-like glycosyl hydrolase|nr:hypothetical protein [Atopobiaceae bacterium]